MATIQFAPLIIILSWLSLWFEGWSSMYFSTRMMRIQFPWEKWFQQLGHFIDIYSLFLVAVLQNTGKSGTRHSNIPADVFWHPTASADRLALFIFGTRALD